jgi:hypothetical protein
VAARAAAADTAALGHVMDLVRQARELAGHSA